MTWQGTSSFFEGEKPTLDQGGLLTKDGKDVRPDWMKSFDLGGDYLVGAKQKKQAPPPPDYAGAANSQADASKQAANQTTLANRPNQYTGFGSNQWVQGPNGQWSQVTGLNSTLGGALSNLQSQAANNAATGPQSIADARNQAITANYNQATSRLNPQWQMADEQLQTQLANQGLDPNSAASRAAMLQQSQAKNDAYGSAMNASIGLGNQTEQAQLAAQMAPYQQMSFMQNYQNGLPGFNAAAQWQTPDYLRAAEDLGNYNMQAWQGESQAQGDAMGGIGSAVGAIASDKRIKSHVKRLPVEAAPGIPMATFKYRHAPEAGHHLGVIAQDVEKVRPDAVHTGPHGIKSVDYSKLKPFGVK